MIDLIIAAIIRYGSSFLSLLTSLYIAKELGAADFGKFSLTIFICTAVASISSFSIQRTVLMFTRGDGPENVGRIFATYLSVLVLSSLLTFFFSFLFYEFYISLLIAVTVAGIQWQLFSSSLVIVNSMYSIRKNQTFFFIGRAVCLISVYLFSIDDSTYISYLSIMAFCLLLPLI
ncbi:hypothetical protein, partial [Shewanella sp. 10N.286.51.B7]|uniref:hypothetical protein n=1 Tax=Shewanella sp. 10N.286.51.B7 TaxID=1880836 RepID=UPI0010561B23